MTIAGLNADEAQAFRVLQRSLGKKRIDIQMRFGTLYDLVDDLKIGKRVRLFGGGGLGYTMPVWGMIVFRPTDYCNTGIATLQSCVRALKECRDTGWRQEMILDKFVGVGRVGDVPYPIVDYEISPEGDLILHTEYLDMSWG